MTSPLTRLDRASTVLLLIDPQERLMPAVADYERVIGATRLLLRASAILHLPVVATTQYEKGLGPLVFEVAELLPRTCHRMEKVVFSCFDDERFPPLLARAVAERDVIGTDGEAAPGAVTGRRPTLLVAGIEAHICVAGTVLGALRHGYDVEVVTDAVSSRSTADREVGLGRMKEAGALLTSSEMATYELLRESSTADFKGMLPFFKGAP